jgi:hypothetical protein
VPPGRAKRPGIVVLTLPLYRKYRIFEPVFHFFRRGGGGEAGKHSRKPAGRQGPDRSRAERAEKDAE